MSIPGGQVRPPQAKSGPAQKQEASDAVRREDLPRGETRLSRGVEGSESYECYELRADGTLKKSILTEGKVTTTTYYAENGTTPEMIIRRQELESGNVSVVKSYADGRLESWSGTRAEEEQRQEEMMASLGMDKEMIAKLKKGVPTPFDEAAVAKLKMRKQAALFGDAKSAVTGPDKKKAEAEAPASSPPSAPASTPASAPPKKPEEKE